MDKKTIGGFIAALRKANGMTQRELADRLGVSDKTVSRWERDDGAPDLSLVPVLAEIFGVTCDELLRGERSSPESRESAASTTSNEKAEKQRRRLLALSLTKFRNRSWISIGIAVVGLLTAAIVNLGFLRAVLGFFLGAVFFLAAAICEAIWINSAHLSVSDDTLSSDEILSFRRSVFRQAEAVYVVISVLLGFTCPLLFICNAYAGLHGGSWLLGGLITGSIGLIAVSVLLYFLHGSLLKKGRYPLKEQEIPGYLHNRRWKKICTFLCLGACMVTFFLHMSLTQIWGPFTIMKGTTFHDYESFIAYMEQDIANPHVIGEEAPVRDTSENATYYDEFGNEISEEEALQETLEDSDGNIFCTYIRRNNSVCSIQFAPENGSALPITVYTYEDLETAQQTAAIRHILFTVAYSAEGIAALLLYFKKRTK